MIKVDGKKIITNTGELIFENNVKEVVEKDGIIVIVLDNNKNRNVYCYKTNHQFLWQIKRVPMYIGGTRESTYVGINLNNDVCNVIDFFCRSFTVDITNGEIISMNIVK